MSKRLLWGGIGGIAVLLVAAAAFLAWGPIGLGPGPVSVAFVSSSGTVPLTQPVMILVPIQASPSTHAVIDGIGIAGGAGYPPPQLIGVAGDNDQSCTGIWWPLSGKNSFQQRCATDGTVPLVDTTLPMLPPALDSAPGEPPARGIEVVLTVAPPGPGGCWAVSKVTVHYTVGGRHYTAAGTESVSGCTSAVQPAS